MPRGWPIVLALCGLAAVFVVIAALYASGSLQLLVSETTGRHTKHAILFLGLAVLSLIAANFARPRPDTA